MQNLETRLKQAVETLCKSERNTGRCPEGLHAAADFLESASRGLGLHAIRQEIHAGGVACANIEAVAPTYAGNDSPHIVIGAHYDSIEGTVGADDNASAVAVLLEVARLLKDAPSISKIRFVAYANEEPPHFASSSLRLVYDSAHLVGPPKAEQV